MIRKLAHTLLASAFAVDAVQMLQKPEKYTGEAKATAGALRTALPANMAKSVPADDVTNVRIMAGTKAVASLLVATNKAPRVGAFTLAALQIPTTATRRAFWNESNKDKKQTKQLGLVTDLTLLGALMATTLDTQGKPSVAWRVKKAMPGKSEQEKMLENAQQQSKEFAASAQSQASDFFGTAKEKVSELVDNVSDYVDDNKDDWAETAENLRDQAVDFGHQAVDFAQDKGQDLKKNTKKARKQARKDLKKAKKKAEKKYL